MSDASTTSAGAAVPAEAPETGPHLGPAGVIALAAWCGLAAGLLEAGATVLYVNLLAKDQIYRMSRHFTWMQPLGNLALFLALGLALALAVRLWPKVGSRATAYILATLTPLPALMVLMPYIYDVALAAFALGVARLLVSLAAAHPTTARRLVAWGLPTQAAVVAILAGLTLGRAPMAEARQAARPRPTAGAPNVLLLVLDTVRADHLGLYGYARETTPNLDRWAKQGVRFDQAMAPAPWTLPSHASLFTGRWPHELSADFLTPLDAAFPTLAEHLGSHGYATAGFVANLNYCASDSGLGRGFARYEDYLTTPTEVLAITELGDRLKALARGTLALARGLASGPRGGVPAAGAGAGVGASGGGSKPAGWSPKDLVRSLFRGRRKDAELLNGQFLDWLAKRPDPDRPFFAFLNYYDAHDPYIPPAGYDRHFGLRPESSADHALLRGWWDVPKATLSPRDVELVRDAYDDCIGYLDDRLGRLFDELRRRGLLEDTLVIVTADHGEAFGEHAIFGHGGSLFQPEEHVPLMIFGPGVPAGREVAGPVSLRDLPATIVDLAGLGAGSPLPGSSLAPYWSAVDPPGGSAGPVLMEIKGAAPRPMNGHSPASRGPMAGLAEGDLVYIRSGGDGREELYDLASDPDQARDLAGDPARAGDLGRLRAAIERLGATPAPPRRDEARPMRPPMARAGTPATIARSGRGAGSTTGSAGGEASPGRTDDE
jgi:arylsulfatase A-like enzyme